MQLRNKALRLAVTGLFFTVMKLLTRNTGFLFSINKLKISLKHQAMRCPLTTAAPAYPIVLSRSMKDLLKKFEDKQPEIVFNWKDVETEAEGWTVINSLRGGVAGGGTRMRKGLDMNEVLSLAKTMEVKFSVSGPAIGGAKSGINFDPNDPRKKEVLQRWYKAVSPLLKSYYGTGGDLNVDEIHEVIPMTEACGVWHPQEGVFNGHFKPTEADKINRIGQLRQGVVKVIENTTFSPDIAKKYTVADMITEIGRAHV